MPIVILIALGLGGYGLYKHHKAKVLASHPAGLDIGKPGAGPIDYHVLVPTPTGPVAVPVSAVSTIMAQAAMPVAKVTMPTLDPNTGNADIGIHAPRHVSSGRYNQIVVDPWGYQAMMDNRNGTDYLKGGR